MPEFRPEPRIQIQTHTIAGKRVVALISQHGTAAISSNGITVEAEWPNLPDLALKAARMGVARIRRAR